MKKTNRDYLKLFENIYLIKDIYWKFIEINTFLIISCGEAALIDTGIRMMGKKILKVFNHFCSLQKAFQLKYIIITHAHNDHMGSVRVLKEKTKALVACHLLDVPWLEDINLQFKETFCRFTPPSKEKKEDFDKVVEGNVRCDIILRDKDVLEVGELKLIIIHSPGHTPGSISIYVPELKVLFTGDNLQWTHEFIRIGHLGLLTDAISYYKTLRKLQQINASYILPGHFSIISGKKINETFALCFKQYNKFEEELRMILRSRSLTLKEIKNEIISRINAHADEDSELCTTYAFLNKLLQEGKVIKKEEWYLTQE
ncbi:MAG: MBL fold metallo-hydrolase [Nitrososphaeria archaeon]